MSSAIVVLGMHRSGTSCVAGMFAAAGVATAGDDAVRNWDNARGHHELLDLVRLDEAVLAHSGGHWLSAPHELRWTDEHAAARDRVLATRVGGRPALLGDPRMLLALPFWRASRVPFHVVGVVRHPLAVARSLESWRGMPLGEAIALWSVHNRALADDRARHGYAIVDFEQPKAAVVAAVRAALPMPVDEAVLAAAYDEQLVHHDDGDAPALAGLDVAIALYRELAGAESPRAARAAFPRAALAEIARLVSTGNAAAALVPARAAVAAVADAAAVIVPIATLFARHHAHAEGRALIDEHAARLDAGLAALLRGKIALACGDAATAERELAAACAADQPLFQARHLWPHALRAAGKHDEARAALRELARAALYPHGPLATLAEWSWHAGDRAAALVEIEQAIAAAPPHRRGRLRTRRAEWLVAEGEPAAARGELELALVEDPGYGRSRELLASLR